MKAAALLVALALPGAASAARAAGPVIIHEWGTFTSLQDEHGQAIGGINVDDEPVPPFVWNVAGTTVVSPHADQDVFGNQASFGLPPYFEGKGWATGDPAVTMRLETPVLYIYPPKGEAATSVPPLDVHVEFHGGVLSQYYPFATATGLPLNGWAPYFQGALTGTTATGLTWKGVRVGAPGQLLATDDPGMKDAPPYFRGQPVETDDKVWTTPRETAAPLLQVRVTQADAQGSHTLTQTEHFLFYRGIGHLDSPLQLFGEFGGLQANDRSISAPGSLCLTGIAAGWVVDIQPDGGCAFRPYRPAPENDRMIFDSVEFGGPENASNLIGSADIGFSPADFHAGNLSKLQASMQAALVKEGLFRDEASAMLRTWELSYFKSPGLRFFYIVPRAWVDKTLPLTVTGAPVQVTRVMVGRIELVTPAQRAAMERLAAGPCPDLDAFKQAALAALKDKKWSDAERQAFRDGTRPIAELGIPIPSLIADYLSLGRFRDALLNDEFQHTKSMALAKFLNENKIAPPGVVLKGRDLVPIRPGVSWDSFDYTPAPQL